MNPVGRPRRWSAGGRIARWLCRWDGHLLTFAQDDPRPREYNPNGTMRLRKARVVCDRCGYDSAADQRRKQAS